MKGNQSQTHYTDPVSVVDEITTSDELHAALQSEKPTVIKLHSQNCPYCNMFSKTFENEAKKYPNITFLAADGKKLNAPKIIKNFDNSVIIPGYPSVVYIHHGKIVAHQIGGNVEVFKQNIQKLSK